MSQFKSGDIVMLKSGGPTMTVSKEIKEGPYKGRISCQWFGGKKLEEGHFPPESLKAASENGK